LVSSVDRVMLLADACIWVAAADTPCTTPLTLASKESASAVIDAFFSASARSAARNCSVRITSICTAALRKTSTEPAIRPISSRRPR
jgi:hypothetical protein